MSDKINHPQHYTNGGASIECIDYLTSHGMEYCQGNIIKYVTRYKRKNGIEDLRKAEWYIKRLIEEEEKRADKESKGRLRNNRSARSKQNKRASRKKTGVHKRNSRKE